MKDIIITVICAVLGSKALEAVVVAIIDRIKNRKRKPSAMETAVRLLLQDKIEYLCTKAIQTGKTTRSQKTFLKQCYETYHEGLKGNGDLGQLWTDYNNLPVTY